ncbi:hypothetical protein INT45_014285 [Circinella minor]|uniref:FHA domain-containing protein n=1 Tax=Circinella minor TaxID=1195481 RepID=A0A8H7SCB9_9FUNG|nr:hypothetical protein INT45_014285 [Circinella minor]
MTTSQLQQRTEEEEEVKSNGQKLTMVQSPSMGVVTVILQPRHSMFQTKTLELRDKIHLRIGRQTSSKTAPGPLNGYFDSKVLSRTHAEIWSEKTKVYIKDVKSSNGTFLNGQRLSNENEESLPMELKSTDELEFGIDISQDDGSILYHKVACLVHILQTSLSQVDNNMLKELNVGLSNGLDHNHNHRNTLQRQSSNSSISTISSATGSTTLDYSSSSISNNTNNNNNNNNKRSGRNWEVLLAKLQAEVQRSKLLENQLRSVKDVISDIDKALNNNRMEKADARIILLQQKLHEAQQKVTSYAEKCRHQDQAIIAASKELHRLQNTIYQLQQNHRNNNNNNNDDDDGDHDKEENDVLGDTQRQVEELKWILDEQKFRLNKDLAAEKARCIEYENKCLLLERRIKKLEQERKPTTSLVDVLQMRAVQIALAILMGIISALLYVLIAI